MIKLLGLQVFDGPSVYSHKPVARLFVKMEEYIDTPSTEIEGFYSHLTSHFPGLKSHFCSKGYAGGFLERLKEGTYLAHIIEHLCLEVQSVLGYNVKYGKTRRAEDDCYDIVFGYEKRQIIEPCVHFVMDFIISFLKMKKFDFIKRFSQIKEMNKQEVVDLCRPVPGLIISAAGKADNTALCREISTLLLKAGYHTGIAAAQGLFRDGICIDERNAADYAGAKKILADPFMDAVILETGWQSILKDGLAYNKADVCIFTGMEADSLKNSNKGSRQDQDGMERMLHIQSLAVEAVKKEGICVLNADDACIVPLMERARGRFILYGKNENTPVMKNHMIRGGEAVFTEKGSIFSMKDRYKKRLALLEDIHFFSASSDDAIYTALAAAAACIAIEVCTDKTDNHLLQKLGTIRTSSV
jgi:hypothetical protein